MSTRTTIPTMQTLTELDYHYNGSIETRRCLYSAAGLPIYFERNIMGSWNVRSAAGQEYGRLAQTMDNTWLVMVRCGEWRWAVNVVHTFDSALQCLIEPDRA